MKERADYVLIVLNDDGGGDTAAKPAMHAHEAWVVPGSTHGQQAAIGQPALQCLPPGLMHVQSDAMLQRAAGCAATATPCAGEPVRR